MKKIISLLIVALMLAGMSLPAFAYYEGWDWIDDYSDFPEADRYLNDNISNYFVSAAYDLRNNGDPALYWYDDYFFAYKTTEEFYNSYVKRNEKGEIIVPPLVTSSPVDVFIPMAYAQGKTTLTPKMMHLIRDHSDICYYCFKKTTACELEKAAVQVFLAPWTLYQSGEFYTWKDIAEMSDDDLSKIDMSSYSFYKYITSVKDTLIGYGWWKEEYTERYNALYAHANDWINSLEDKSTFEYKGEKRYYAEITEEVRLYGSDHDMIMYSDEFDMFSEEFENAVKNAPNGIISSFAACYSEDITDFDLLDRFEKGGIWRYDWRYIDWHIFMINYLKGDTKEFDEIYSSLYDRGLTGSEFDRVPYYSGVYKYFEIHPISAGELEQEIIAQYGISNILGRNDAKKMANAMINGSLFDLADCYRRRYEFILDPMLGPLDIRHLTFDMPLDQDFDCVDPERSLKQLEEAYEFYKSNHDSSDYWYEKAEQTYKDALECIRNSTKPPVTADDSAVYIVIASISLAVTAGVSLISAKKKKCTEENL